MMSWFIAGIFIGFIAGVIIDSMDTYFTHREYFDKQRELRKKERMHDEWDKSGFRVEE